MIANFGLLWIVILLTREHSVEISKVNVSASWEKMLGNLFAYLLSLAVPLPLAICWLINRFKTGRFFQICALLAVATPCLF